MTLGLELELFPLVHHAFQLLFHINYSTNESGAAFIKLSEGEDIYKAAAQQTSPTDRAHRSAAVAPP